MQSLVSDCFSPIFSYLSLADLLNLRTASHRLKQEVDDYLPKVRSLSLYLTTPRTPEAIAKYERFLYPYIFMLEQSRENPETWSERLDPFNRLGVRRLSFGTSGLETLEDKTILQNQDHFRLTDFIIIQHVSALSRFLTFIKEHCSKIDKLAMVIDDTDNYLPEVPKVLEAFPAIKVLLLENTFQDSCRGSFPNLSHVYRYKYLEWAKENFIEIPPEVCNSILELSSLEKLYLFSKRRSSLDGSHSTRNVRKKFVGPLFGKLKVLHFNTNDEYFDLPVDGIMDGPLEELAWISDHWLRKIDIVIFPKLKKFIKYGMDWVPWNLVSLPRPSLKVLDVSIFEHYFDWKSMTNLASFTGLERFHCYALYHAVIDGEYGCRIFANSDNDGDDEPVSKKKRAQKDEEYGDYSEEIVQDNQKNWTIKHLQLTKGSESAEERIRDARRWSKYFMAMETCVFLEPEYHEIQINEILDRK